MSKKFNLTAENFGVLDEIANKVEEVEAKANFNLMEIKLDDIELNPKNSFGIRDIEELAESLKKYGQLHNAVVRKVEGSEKPYRMISGERRYRAAKMLGWSSLICKIVICDDIDEEILLIIANLDTRDLDDMERSKNAQRLVELITAKRAQGEDFGGKKTRDIVAEKMKIAPATVQKLIGLQKLIPEFEEMVRNKEIGLELANQYAQMTEEMQKLVYNSLQEGLKLTAKTAKELKDKLKQAEESFDKVIGDMKQQIADKDTELQKSKQEAENKSKLIEKVNKELQEVKQSQKEKEIEMEKARELIRKEIEEELSKESQDNSKLDELQEKLQKANEELNKAKDEAEKEISELKEKIEDIEEDKEKVISEYENKLKDNKASVNQDNIIKNIEISALAKQASKVITSIVVKIAELNQQEGFKLNEESQKSIEHILKQIEVLAPKK